MEAKDFEALDDKVNQAKIEAEAQARAIVEAAKKPENIVRTGVSNQVANKIKTDETTKTRINATADKIVNSSLTAVENEADASENSSIKDKLQTYFDAHKTELKTAGIDAPTYLEDMERAVKWHRKWCKVHWCLFGWWMTGIRTFILKAKPFKVILNILAILLGIGVGAGIILGLIKLFSLF